MSMHSKAVLNCRVGARGVARRGDCLTGANVALRTDGPRVATTFPGCHAASGLWYIFECHLVIQFNSPLNFYRQFELHSAAPVKVARSGGGGANSK